MQRTTFVLAMTAARIVANAFDEEPIFLDLWLESIIGLLRCFYEVYALQAIVYRDASSVNPDPSRWA